MTVRSVSSIIQERFYRKHTAAEPTSTTPVLVAPEHPETWSDGKQLAMLSVGQFLSEKIKDCVQHMRDNGVRCSQQDFADIRNNGLAFKRSVTDRYHALTPTGIRYVHDVAEIVAKKLKLHHMKRNDGSQSVASKCACGWFTSHDRKYGGEEAKRLRAEQAHFANPDAWIAERARVDAGWQKIVDKSFGGSVDKSFGGSNG